MAAPFGPHSDEDLRWRPGAPQACHFASVIANNLSIGNPQAANASERAESSSRSLPNILGLPVVGLCLKDTTHVVREVHRLAHFHMESTRVGEYGGIEYGGLPVKCCVFISGSRAALPKASRRAPARVTIARRSMH